MQSMTRTSQQVRQGVLESRNVHDSDDCLLETATFEYCGGFYEVVDIPRVLERYGLPSKITADMAGDHLT